MKGSPLSATVAFAIKKRFGISLDFLWDGEPAALLHVLVLKLRNWERDKDRRIFANYGGPK